MTFVVQFSAYNLLCILKMQFDLLQEVFYQTGIGGIIYSKYFTRAWCRVFLKQTVEKARKLGLLHTQKFRSRTRAIEVAGTQRACLRGMPDTMLIQMESPGL